MTFRDQLEKIKACPESLIWVKDKTIEEAWKTCKNSNWMLWILSKTGLDLATPICDIAEEVLHVVPEESQLACIWAISAARRRASKDELDAAYEAAYEADGCCSIAYNASHASNAAAYAITASTYAVDAFRTTVAVHAARYAQYAAMSAASAVYYARGSAACRKEEKKQCDILRKHFTIDQVREAFNKLVA